MPGHVASVASTLFTEEDTSLAAAMKVMRAKSVQQAINAATDYVAPAQNLTLVDRDTIAMKTIGAMPRRDFKKEVHGALRRRSF